jgi:hypothetical protein
MASCAKRTVGKAAGRIRKKAGFLLTGGNWYFFLRKRYSFCNSKA